MQFEIELINFSAEDYEQLGTKEKFWFARPDENGRVDVFLFKFSRENTGEHWSEKVAEQLCEILDIPHAKYNLAICKMEDGKERYGVSSHIISPSGLYQMVMGNEALFKYHHTSYPKPKKNITRNEHEHTVSRVLNFLNDDITFYFYIDDVTDPNDTLNAADVFCGYLMLDVLISNQDRHHENWAILVETETQKKYLCPTYDHAASLGRELTDEQRKNRLESKDKKYQITNFVTRARSALFLSKEDKKPLSTLDAFFEAINSRNIEVKEYWLSKLSLITEDSVQEILDKFPNYIMSKISKEFAKQIILKNKERILNSD